MTINDFNSKLNLPAYCSDQGITGYEFVKLPRFGWFAYNHKRNDIKRIFDFLDRKNISTEVTYLLREKSNLHEFRMLYSEMGVRRLMLDFTRYILADQLWADAQRLFKETKAYAKGCLINPYDELAKNDALKFMQVKPGLITTELLSQKKYSCLTLPKTLANKMMIPTFCSPMHLCSLEYCALDGINKRDTLYDSGAAEAGWIGTELRGVACTDLRTLQWKQGFGWNYKADYWTDHIIEIDPKMSTADCLQLWKEAHHTEFTNSPLDVIEINKKEGEIGAFIRDLSQGQIAQLEKRFGKDFLNTWKQLNFQEIKIGCLKFIQRDNQYFIQKDESIEEFTNFTVTIERIIKKGGLFFRAGYISYQNTSIPFELENHHFLSSKGLVKKICEIFFEGGVGIPIVYNAYQSFLIDVINRFNRNIVIESSTS